MSTSCQISIQKYDKNNKRNIFVFLLIYDKILLRSVQKNRQNTLIININNINKFFIRSWLYNDFKIQSSFKKYSVKILEIVLTDSLIRRLNDFS